MTPISTATNTAGRPIKVGKYPSAIVIAPGGKTAYVLNAGSSTVTPIRLATGKAETAIAVASRPVSIAITPAVPAS